jgi:3-phosphoshikimate 1-carboxyvinyltransferase
MSRSAIVHPCPEFGGAVRVPGDKSISHRVAMLAGLAEGESTVDGFLFSQDCLSSLQAMEALGARAHQDENGRLRIEGAGGRLRQPAGMLDAGNSGTTMRLLAGLIAGYPLAVEITGDDSLRRRPMDRIQAPLERMGARVELLGPGQCAPIRIRGGALKGIEYDLPVASAQVKSCVLLAGLAAAGRTLVREPRPTRDHTERLLRSAGVDVRVRGLEIELEGGGLERLRLRPVHWVVPGDFSSACFHILAAAARPGGRLTVRGVGLNPRRTAFLDVLRRMGAGIEVTSAPDAGTVEPIGDLTVTGAELEGVEVGGDQIPNLIDELPLVAVAGALARRGRTVIRDARELRVKESDRIHSMAVNLAACGAAVEEQADGLKVSGGAALAAGQALPSFGDHRVAMCMAVAALFSKKPVCITQVACVDTSYPEFWNDLKSLGAHVEL